MATRYIATTGNDSNAGTEGSPWLTLSKGWTGSTTGDTIIVKAGTYTKSAADSITTTAGNPKILTFTGEDGAIIDYNGFASRFNFNAGEVNTLIFENITFKNGNGGTGTSYSVGWVVNGVGQGDKSCTITFDSCQILDMKYHRFMGMRGYGNQVNFTLTNSLIDGFQGYNSASSELFLRSGTTDVWNITGNTIYMPTATYMYTNVFSLTNTAGTSTIKNNIFSMDGVMQYGTLTSGTLAIDHNDFYNIAGSVPAVVTNGTGNITLDPLLVDPSNDNFNLRPPSPCIDSGVLI